MGLRQLAHHLEALDHDLHVGAVGLLRRAPDLRHLRRVHQPQVNTEFLAQVTDPLPGSAGFDANEGGARKLGKERLQLLTTTAKGRLHDLAGLPVEDLTDEDGLVMVGHAPYPAPWRRPSTPSSYSTPTGSRPRSRPLSSAGTPSTIHFAGGAPFRW